MITRGFYIGEIIDELATIAQQVTIRNRLGLTDLTVFAENFFRDILNILLEADLKNLNEDRSNEPGLDLGDKAKKLAIQVTSTATVAKINNTLDKVTAEQIKIYSKIIVLIIGKKQSSYTENKPLWQKCNFSSENIWDINTLSQSAIGLEIEKLQQLHSKIRTEIAKVKVELEIPNEDGVFPTSGYDNWEKRIKPKIGNGDSFISYLSNHEDIPLDEKDIEDIKKAIKKLGGSLSRLPRITREFMVMLYERRETKKSKRFNDDYHIHLLYQKVEREYQGVDLKGELSILEDAAFINIEGEDTYNYGPPAIGLRISPTNDELAAFFLPFIIEKKLSLRKVIGEADLSAF